MIVINYNKILMNLYKLSKNELLDWINELT
jgi:hypothetical protein